MKKTALISVGIIACLFSFAYACNHHKSSLINQGQGITEFADNSKTWGPTLFMDQTEEEFFYDVNSRFNITVTKEDLLRAEAVTDIIPKRLSDQAASYDSVRVIVLDDYHETDRTELGDGGLFNEAQTRLFRSLDYSTNILIRAYYTEAGTMSKTYCTPYMTIVPEKKAEYEGGREALLSYLKENSTKHISVVKADSVRPGKIYFTVNKDGQVSDIRLTTSCGYPSVDDTMLRLLETMPGKWTPAKNSNNESVAQDLVFSFGNIGC